MVLVTHMNVLVPVGPTVLGGEWDHFSFSFFSPGWNDHSMIHESYSRIGPSLHRIENMPGKRTSQERDYARIENIPGERICQNRECQNRECQNREYARRENMPEQSRTRRNTREHQQQNSTLLISCVNEILLVVQ